jgi:RNA polymerase sigma-70 factor (sigma-E family)
VQGLDDEQFADFVAARSHALLRTAYLLTGDQHLAEDLVQTALEKAATHWGSIRVAAAAETYVRRTMYREQVTLWRRRRLTELPMSEIPEQRRPGATGAADDTVEDRMVLRDALMTLGRRQRTVLVLRYFEDLTEQQVADALGISLGTVKSTAHKALTRLRELCGNHAPATGGEVA